MSGSRDDREPERALAPGAARVRDELPGDAAAVRRVNLEAFGREPEANLVDRLRGRVSPCVSLVAEVDVEGAGGAEVPAGHEGAAVAEGTREGGTPAPEPGARTEIVGHAFLGPVSVHGGGPAWHAVALGPMAVLPSHQHRGIGSALVETMLERARALREDVVFVLGHPEFYSRFGFRSATPAFWYGRPGDNPAFMLLELRCGAAGDRAGEVRYPAEFEGVD